MLQRHSIAIPILEHLELHGIAQVQQLKARSVEIRIFPLHGHINRRFATEMLMASVLGDGLLQFDLLDFLLEAVQVPVAQFQELLRRQSLLLFLQLLREPSKFLAQNVRFRCMTQFDLVPVIYSASVIRIQERVSVIRIQERMGDISIPLRFLGQRFGLPTIWVFAFQHVLEYVGLKQTRLI